MLFKKKAKVEFVDSRTEREEIKGFSVRGIIDGSFLARASFVKQLPFILYLVLMAIIYIANRYHAEKMVRQITDLKKEVKDLRSEQITTASELMNLSVPSKVQALVDEKEIGLKHPTKPHYKIIAEKK